MKNTRIVSITVLILFVSVFFIQCRDDDFDDNPPSVPTGVTAGGSSSAIWVTWNASTDDTGVAFYKVLRNSSGFGWTVSDTKFKDTAVCCGYSYCYEVRAHDGYGNRSAWSPPACARAQ